MNRFGIGAAFAVMLSLGSAALGGEVLLYDGSLATTPAGQGWTSVIPAASATETLSGRAVTLDTTINGNGVQAGYARSPFFGNAVPLDSSTGFLLSFTARVEAELHANDNRAGFSVIVLDNAHKGVELGFWTNRIFAQNLIGTSFVQAGASERAENVNTTAFARYSLLFSGGGYALSRDGSPLFSGAFRDYSAGNPVYLTRNFLFFGDDTSSAAARWSLQSVSISAVPEPGMTVMLLTGFLVIGLALRRRGAFV